MMKKICAGLISVVAATASPVSAATYTFTFTAPYQMTWEIESSPTPYYDSGDGFSMINVLPTYGSNYIYDTGPQLVYFYGSGFGIQSLQYFDPAVQFSGPTLFTRVNGKPLFKLGTFNFDDGDGNYPVLTISGPAITAVPEPENWALLIGGFLAAGVSLRRRRSTVRVTYASVR